MSVAKHPKTGKWYAKFRYRDYSGRIIQKKKEGFLRKADAQEWENQFLALHDGTAAVTFRYAYEQYLEDSRKRVKIMSMQNKKYSFNHFSAFYDLRLSDITAKTIRNWQNDFLLAVDKKTGKMIYTKASIRQINTQLSNFFGWCERFCGLKGNPVHAAGRLTYQSVTEKPSAPRQIWQKKQFDEFLSALPSQKYRLIYSLLFWCGLRRGEVLGLRLEDFDEEKKLVRVRKNRIIHRILDTPKTRSSIRDVMLPRHLVMSLRDYISQKQLKGTNTLIFGDTSPAVLTENFLFYQRKSKISPRIRLHDLRHSHASMLINAGFSPDVVADRLGHKNAKMVLEIYGHMYPQKRVELTDTLDRLYNGELPKGPPTDAKGSRS